MSTDNITPAPPVSHNVSLFLQPTGTTENDIEARVDVTESAEYQEIRDLVNLALYHLASSPKAGMVIYSILLNVLVLDCRAADAFATLNGELAIPTQEKAIEDLTTCPPDFIICDIKDNDDGSIRLGRVKKGQTDLACRHELFISRELCDAIMAKTNLGEPQARRLRTFHRAILLFVLSHEMMHALVKKTFSPLIFPPNPVNGAESGFCFENTYFRFELLAELPKEGLVKGQRLWKISDLLAVGKQKYTLNDTAVLQLVQSFATPDRYEPDVAEAIAPPFQANTVRWKACCCSDDILERTAAAASRGTRLEFLMQREGYEYHRC
ncbi:hypothetical protein C8J57DRAFT_1219329 [Mycena rebaudengoi]|nr:hypothetical protein C8J57DRAFT_1219329 [Mycena rebaudengoi]